MFKVERRRFQRRALPVVPQRASAPPPAPATTAAPPPAYPIGHGWTATVTTIDESRGGSVWQFLPVGSGGSHGVAALGLAALLLSATAVAARHRIGVRLPKLAAPSSSAATPLEAEPSVAAVEDAAAAAQPAAPDAAKSTPPPPPPPQPPRSPRSLVERLSAAASEMPTVIDSEPPLLPRTHSSAGTDSDVGGTAADGWAAILEMRIAAEVLLDLDRQILADHVPAGPLREILAADLDAIAVRLQAPELSAAFDAGHIDVLHPVYSQAIADLERTRTLARIEHERTLEVAATRDRSPGDVDQAYSFLGVNPRAGDAVVKKAVDALRQNWHPDLASDEPDRQAREARIKHINAAWDLIRAR